MNRPDSAIRLQAAVIDPAELAQKTVTVVSQSLLATKLGRKPQRAIDNTLLAGEDPSPVFTKPEELQQSEWNGDVPNMAGQGAALV